jgi:acetyl esterase/lipase
MGQVASYTSWFVVIPTTIAVIGLCVRPLRPRGVRILVGIASLSTLGALVVMIRMLHVASTEGVRVDLAKTFGLRNVSRAGSPDESVIYGSYDGTKLGVAIYRTHSNGDPGVPVLVYVHGGGWISGSRLDRNADMRWFSERGWLVFSFDYLLSNERRHLWDQTVEQVGCALAWVAANAARYGGDIRRISMFGDSAGGNLVINAAYMGSQHQLRSSCGGTVPSVATVLTVYPGVDPASVYENANSLAGRFGREMVRDYVGGSPEQFPDRYAVVASRTYISKSAPPTLIVVGEIDHLVPTEATLAFVDQARATGVEIRLIRVPYGQHAFDLVSGNIGNQIVRQASAQFLIGHGQAP